MGEKIWVTPPGGLKVRHVGLLDLEEFYKWLFRWLEFEEYIKEETYERAYDEQTTPAGKQIFMVWHGVKPKTKDFSYVIDIKWILVGVNSVEVQKDEKKVKIFKGDFDLRIISYVEKTIRSRGILRLIYDRFIIRKRTEEHKSLLYDKVATLQNEIINYFNQYVI